MSLAARVRSGSPRRGFYETRDPAQVSHDGRSTYLAAVFRDVPDGQIEEAAERLEEELDAPGVLLGGGALAGPAVGEQVGEDIGRAEAIAFPILFALSLLFFRGFVAALLPLFVGMLTIFGAFLCMRLVNEAIPLSIFVINLVIALGHLRRLPEPACGSRPTSAARHTTGSRSVWTTFSRLSPSSREPRWG